MAGNDRRDRRQHDQWQQQHPGAEPKENIAVGGRAFQHERCLSGVVQDQAWKHDRKPGEFDRPPAEMTHIGIERLGAGDTEKHRAQYQKAGRPMREQIRKTVDGIECGKHGRVLHNA